MKKLMTAAVTMLAALAFLLPAGSAQASQLSDSTWCQGSNNAGMTLAPGKMCTWWPLTVHYGYAFWDITKAGSGQVCLAVGHYQGSQFVTNAGAGWTCRPVRNIFDGSSSGVNAISVQNGFGASYGQIAILNYSSATIKTKAGSGMDVQYYK